MPQNRCSRGLYRVILYYVLIDAETPTHQKGVILGALFNPRDLVPTSCRFGFSDDLAALSAALKMIWSSVHSRHLAQAETRLDLDLKPHRLVSEI